jgi:phenolic acid decarboxylase
MSKYTLQPYFSYASYFKNFYKNIRSNDILYKNGRTSLFEAIISLKAEHKCEKILIPSFICNDIIPAIDESGIEYDYYLIKNDLTIDFRSLESKIIPNKTIVMGVNYFGFPADWVSINKLKDKYKLFTIEDNTHDHQTLGCYGDISFNSLRKVLPLLSGSVLKKNNLQVKINHNKKYQLPSFGELLYSIRWLSFSKKSVGLNIKNNDLAYDKKNIFMDYISAAIYCNSNYIIDSNSSKRLINYQKWEAYLKEKGLIFFDNLPNKEGLSPYGFPCIAKNREAVKYWLDWGSKNNITVINWPNFPDNHKYHDNKSILRNVLLFPVNHTAILKLQ